MNCQTEFAVQIQIHVGARSPAPIPDCMRRRRARPAGRIVAARTAALPLPTIRVAEASAPAVDIENPAKNTGFRLIAFGGLRVSERIVCVVDALPRQADRGCEHRSIRPALEWTKGFSCGYRKGSRGSARASRASADRDAASQCGPCHEHSMGFLRTASSSRPRATWAY